MPRSPGRPSLLTESLTATIARYIRDGAYFAVACEAAGVSRRVGHLWLERGESVERGEISQEDGQQFLQFLHEVRQARALARRSAETRVFKEHPEVWLKSGPGRGDGEEDPGWRLPARAKDEERGGVAERVLIEALTRLGGLSGGAVPLEVGEVAPVGELASGGADEPVDEDQGVDGEAVG